MFTGKTIGVLGAGNMGQALLRGFLESELLKPHQVIASSLDATILDSLKEELGVRTTMDNGELAREADVILLATKPHIVIPVLTQIQRELTSGQILVSVAAGLSTKTIESALLKDLPVVRVMPNTPSLIGEGVNAFCPGSFAASQDTQMVEALLGSAGLAVQVTEAQMDSVTAISGSGPAYVFLFMEAFYNVAEGLGLDRDSARSLVNQTMRGAVELAIASDDDPAELRRKVTSPGGVTAEAIAVFEQEGFRSMFKNAVQAGHDKSAAMTRESESGQAD